MLVGIKLTHAMMHCCIELRHSHSDCSFYYFTPRDIICELCTPSRPPFTGYWRQVLPLVLLIPANIKPTCAHYMS